MKSTKNFLDELGFNKDAPIETQKAFFKHLIAAANTTSIQKYSPANAKNHSHLDESRDQKKAAEAALVQLEFDLSNPLSKRVS